MACSDLASALVDEGRVLWSVAGVWDDANRWRVTGLIAVVKALAWTATAATMLHGALSLGHGSLRIALQRPALFVRTLAAVWVAVPILTVVLVLLLRIEGLPATVLLIMAVCPGMPSLLSKYRSSEGEVSTAFVALLITAATEPFLLPAWTWALNKIHPPDLVVTMREVWGVLLPTVFGPVAIGFIVRARFPYAAALLLRVTGLLIPVALFVSAALVAVRGFPLLVQVPWNALVGAVMITLADAILGYWVGWPRPKDQTAIALAVALGNPALALAVVEASFPGLQSAALLAVYLVVRGTALAPFRWWLKYRRDRTPPGGGGHPANGAVLRSAKVTDGSAAQGAT